MAPVAVVDADVLIGHLDSTDALHERAEQLLLALADEGIGLRASTVTLAEVLVAPARTGRLREAETALDRLGVEEVPLGADAAHRLAALRARTGCRLPDCCVLLTAEASDGAVLASFDAKVRRAAAALEIEAAGLG